MTLMLGLLFVVATAGVTLLFYGAARYLGSDPEQSTRDLAGSVMFRISALHGLILALVFAQQLVEYQQLKFENATEANAIADVYFDADRYGEEARTNVQQAMQRYAAAVVEREWPSLASTGRLNAATWRDWDIAYNAILDLTPANAREEALRNNMLERIHSISQTRVERENHTAQRIEPMFWFAAVAGVLFVAVAYYPCPPTRANLTLIALFGAFTGLVLFMIYALANPYSEPGALKPTALMRLVDTLEPVAD